MNVDINNYVISKIPNNIIKDNDVSSMNEGMFANLLKSARENQLTFMGNDANSLLGIKDVDSIIEEYNVDLEKNKEENQNHICYENISNMVDILFLRPNLVQSDTIAENISIDINHDVFENQLPPKGMEIINNQAYNEKLEAVLIEQGSSAEKLTREIEVNNGQAKIEVNNAQSNINNAQSRIEVNNEQQIGINILQKNVAHSQEPTIKDSIEQNVEKSKNEYENAEILTVNTPIVENKTITISDESTKIKSQVLSQVKDKIVILTDKTQDLNGVKTITMELRPQNLGKLDIKMIYDNDKLTVEIKALNEETQKILSSNTAELRNLLNKTSEVDVKITVKPYEELKYEPMHNNRGHEQNYYQNNEQSHQNQQGRQRNKYYYENNAKQKENDVFSELIDLNYSKVKEGIHGN